MKKAKKLLAILLAMVMLASAACLPVYAKMATTDLGTPDRMTANQKYYFGAEKGCSYLLDSLDEMLANEYIYMTWDYLMEDADSSSLGLASWAIESLLNMPPLNFTSIDAAVDTVYTIIDEFDSGLDGTIAGWATGDLLDYLNKTGLNPNVIRGNRSDNYSSGSSDMQVLFNLISWLDNNKTLIVKLVAGTLDLGLLDSLISSIKIEGLPILEDIDYYVPILLYKMLVDNTATAMPTGETLESSVQKVINWALVSGTGEAAENGGNSMLGPNTKPLLGEGVFTEDQVSITDISVYQFVNNLINGILNGFLAPELSGIIADLVGVEEDGSVDDMTMFNTIVGVIEGLLTDNGAEAPVYTEPEDSRTPMGMIDDLVRWLLKGNPVTGSDGTVTYANPALYTFIKIDITGIGLTDNFMSLLNDLIRIAINLLPVLGLELPEGLLPSSDALSEVHYYKIVTDEATGAESMVMCDKSDEAKVDQLYQTYTGKKACYAVYKDAEKTEIDYYKYFEGEQLSVNTADSSAADYENPKFIRPYYVMAMDQVWAAVVKAVFTMFVEGPYFPAWANTMESVLAYGCAGLAAPIIPSGDWYDRLDAYHLSGGSTDPYEIKVGKTVNPIAYTDAEGLLPTGAMEIIAGVGAYYLNTMLDLDANTRFTVEGTSFEQLLTELILWALTTYVPILTGEVDLTTGLVYISSYTGTYGETRYPGSYAAETNTLINACYSNFGSRIELANPNWDAVYAYLDATVLSLIPASWLPADFPDAEALFNDWLFGNLMEFDLQGLLSLFTANLDGELSEDLLTVLIRIIDRVLAIVFGGEALMLPTDRNGTGTNSVFARNTEITTLTALLEDGDKANESASLPTLVNRLLNLLNKYKGLLFCTLFPLIMSQSYERPFDHDALNSDDNFVNVLTGDGSGRTMTTYKISNLEDQIRTLTKNVNAIQINKTVYTSTTPVEYGTYTVETDATNAQTELGDNYNYTETVTADDGTVSYVVYRNQTADDVLAIYVAQYGEDADIYVETIEKVAATSTTAAVYEYNVYQSKNYLVSAETTAETETDDAGTYEVYTNFNYKSINASSIANPLVTWDDGAYYFWESEDSNPDAYFYANYNDAVEDANAYVDSYYSFAENTLSDAFGAWFEYSIDGYAIAADVYDANGDGKAVLSTTDSDYVADDANTTDVNEEVPVDGYPSAPDAMYPYYNESDTATVKWVDKEIDDYISQSRSSFSKANYELLVMAEEYGSDPENKVLLDEEYIEKVVRYVLWFYNGNSSSEAMRFDITAEADGSYKGDRQWEDLSETEIANIKAVCDGYHMYLEQNEETGEYEIYRKAFTFVNNLYFSKAPDGATDLSTTPSSTRNYVGDAGPTDYQEAQNAIYDGYLEYADTLYSMRRSLYNQLDTLNWRMEQAEANRATDIDPTMLSWALNHVKSAYISSDNKRNLKYVNTVDGVEQYTKIYTSTSYAAFQTAYDYANSLASDGLGQSSGITQSMVTMAYQKLIEAYNALVEYLGAADWVQYLEYLTLAQEISKTVAEGGYADHETLGLTEQSRADLAAIIEEAIAFGGDVGDAGDLFRSENFDCENQDAIDEMAASINSVILNLKYLSNPNLVVNEGLKIETGTEVDNNGDVHTYGWIIGLTEGEGLLLENVTEVGMLINETKGDYLALEESAKGLGTGARIDGYINSMSRFRYYGILYGDLNGDARVDGTDWAKLSYYLLTNSTDIGMGDAYMMEAANADHQGDVTIADAELIRAHYNYTKTIDQTVSSTGTATTGL